MRVALAMSGKKNTFFWTFLCSVISVALISDVNAKPHDGEHSHHKMRVSRSFSDDDTDVFSSHRFPSDSSFGNTFPRNDHFPSAFGGSSMSSGQNSDFGSKFGSSLFDKEPERTTTPRPSMFEHSMFDKLTPSGDGGFKTKTSMFGEDAEITFHPVSANKPSNQTNNTMSISIGGINIPLQAKDSNVHFTSGWDARAAAEQQPGTVAHHPLYTYRPPSSLQYNTWSGKIDYPVYVGPLPYFVYDYISSGNRYSHLLAGVSLYNLAKVFSDRDVYDFHKRYVPKEDERCKFGVQHGFDTPNEMTIDCQAITYFIYDNNHGMPDPGSLLSKTMNDNWKQAASLIPNTKDIMASAGAGSFFDSPPSRSETTTKAPEVMSITDSRLAGFPVEIKTGMECYVERSVTLSNIKKKIPCDLLETYASQSLYRNSGAMVKSSLTILLMAIVAILMN